MQASEVLERTILDLREAPEDEHVLISLLGDDVQAQIEAAGLDAASPLVAQAMLVVLDVYENLREAMNGRCGEAVTDLALAVVAAYVQANDDGLGLVA